jgi:hypothetical protein
MILIIASHIKNLTAKNGIVLVEGGITVVCKNNRENA